MLRLLRQCFALSAPCLAGIAVPIEEAENIVRDNDKDGNHGLDFDEFSVLFSEVQLRMSSEKGRKVVHIVCVVGTLP